MSSLLNVERDTGVTIGCTDHQSYSTVRDVLHVRNDGEDWKGNAKAKAHLEDLGVDGKTILYCILKQ